MAKGLLWVAIQRARAAIRPSNAPQYGAGACVAIQFCIVTEGSYDTALQRARSDTAGHACNTARGGHDTAGARLQHGRNTAGLSLRHGAVRAAWAQRASSQGLVCAHCVLDPVLTQDTFLSHCLGYYS